MADNENNYTVQDLQDNLNYLSETKTQIKNAIIGKGQEIGANDTFRSYASKIAAIETGVDTSDATATSNDILNPETAYVNGEKITGSITTQYEDVSIDLTKKEITDNIINSNGCVTSNNDGYIMVRDPSGIIRLYKDDTLIKTFSGTFDTTSHSMSLSDCYVSEDKIEMLLYLARGNFNTKVEPYIYKIAFDGTDWSYTKLTTNISIVNESNWNNGAFSMHAKFIKTSTGLYLIMFGGGNASQFRTSSVTYNFFSNETSVIITYSPIVDNYGSGAVGSRNLILIDAFVDNTTGNVIVNYVDWGWKKMYVLNNSLTSILWQSNYSSTYKNNYTNSRYLISESQYIQTTYSGGTVTLKLYNKSDNSLVNQTTFDCPASHIFVNADKNKAFYVVCQYNNSYKIYTFGISNNTISAINYYSYSYTSVNTEQQGRVDMSSYGYRVFGCDTKLVYFINSNTTKKLVSMTRDEKVYRYIDNLITTDTTNVLNGSKYYDSQGEKIGSMPNNGAISYTPTESTINIANGYHNGSTIKPMDITTSKEYIECSIISDYIVDNMVQYTQLDYITMDGNQYIDPNITANQNTNVEIKYLLTGASSGYGRIIGSGSDMNYELCATGSTTNLRWSLNGNGSNVSITSGTAHTYKCYGTGNLDIDGINKVSRTVNQTNTKLWLFDCYAHSERAKGSFYYCKIWQNGVLVRDFVPAKDTNNVVCLYDRATRTFFYNAGTGTFTAGNPVTPEKKYPMIPLEYIQSTGTQYINTEVPASWSNLRISADFVNTKFNGNWDYFIGAGTSDQSAVGIRNDNGSNLKVVNNGDSASMSNTIGTRYKKDFVYNQIVNTGSSYTMTSTSVSYNKNLYLFACNGNSVYGKFSAKIYSLKFYKNNELIKDFVPAKDFNGNIGLFDKVEGKFHYNIGTGTFTAGGVVYNG